MTDSSLLLSIDPGARGCGCAWWGKDATGWVLLQAGYTPGSPGKGDTGPPEWGAAVAAVEEASRALLGALRPGIVVVEQMQVYTRLKGDPRDLLAVASVGGGLFRAFSDARPVGLLPARWKGQTPREILGNRIEKQVRERGWWPRVQIPPRRTNLNDVMHGVGLGFYFARFPE